MTTKLGPYQLGPNDTAENGIYTGDSRELSDAIPDGSIDVIFTDPPYPREFLPLYGWLAETAARVLKPGGFLCAMAGGNYLDEVFARMSGKGLDWYFKIEAFNPGDSPVIWPKRIITRTKPILLWTKGRGVVQIWNMTDVYQGQGKDKRYHEWGQDVGSARYVLEYIFGTGTTGLVFDPFCGGGATLEACKILGLDYLGFELDPEVAARARDRLPKVQMPMPLVVPEQVALWRAT
jgi:DNA modification methylase